MRTIGYARQDISDADCDAVLSALRSDFLTQGPLVEAFERKVAGYSGAAYGVAVCNATAGLHIAYEALGVGPGDLVWTSPNTFASTANAARMLGADVDFIDIDPRTLNLSVESLKAKLEAADRLGRLPKLVVPVHFAGQVCDMKAIADLRTRYGFAIVEDAAHAIGGKHEGAPVGDCRYSDVTVFSFHPVKIITTGEGGLAVTNSPDLAQKMNLLRSHGITRDARLMKGQPDGPWSYEMISLGYNYRLTDIQAALGISQMERLDAFVARRHEIAAAYSRKFADLPIGLPYWEPWQYAALHLYVIRWKHGVGGKDRREAFEALRKLGIGVNVHYMPVHLQPYYKDLGFSRGYCPNAEAYYDEAITIPLFSAMSEEDIDFVVGKIRTVCGAN